MHRIFCGLLLFGSAVAAKEPELALKADGFAVIETFTLTEGAICRKVDRSVSPFPLAWYTRDAWNAIYLLSGTAPQAGAQERAASKSDSACQRGIVQRTLVGPLKKGTWQIYGSSGTTPLKILHFKNSREIESENGAFAFNIEKSAVVAALIHFHSDRNGRCLEYLPLAFTSMKEQSNKNLHVLEATAMEERIFAGHGLCRAMPQTIARGAKEFAAGNYRIIGKDIKRITLYLAD